MKKRIYIGDRSSRQGYWTSFESTPHLTVTRKNIYGRCVPCIENLLDQLINGVQSIELRQAFDCWKVVALLNDEMECFKVLDVYEDLSFSLSHVRGRFGSRESEGKKAVIFHADSEEERDAILSELQQAVKQVNPPAKVFYSRACDYLHGQVLGDGINWEKVTPVKYPENVAEVIRRCKKSLYDW